MSEYLTIGIVGDGQLGRMIVEDGQNYDKQLRFICLGKAGADSPAAQVGATQIEGDLDDPDALRQLTQRSDVTTWEIEHIGAQALQALVDEGHRIEPSPASLAIIQDKLKQKQHLQNRGIDVAPFQEVSRESLDATREKLGDRLMIKTRRGGYDGRGNYLLAADEGWPQIEEAFSGNTDKLYAEKVIPFRRELAFVGARDTRGHTAAYRVVETIQRNNVCYMVFATDIVPKDAEDLGREAMAAFDGAGVFAVEMFETEEGKMLVNEVAPRVHNSGHWTDIGADTSQFEQHVRAIIGDPLGSTRQTAAAAVMTNILSTNKGVFEDYMRTTQTFDNGMGHIRWYGKAPRPGFDRKIGHVTALASDAYQAVARAASLERIARGELE